MEIRSEDMLRLLKPAYEVINIGAALGEYGNDVVTVVGIVNESKWVTCSANTIEAALYKLLGDTLRAVQKED